METQLEKGVWYDFLGLGDDRQIAARYTCSSRNGNGLEFFHFDMAIYRNRNELIEFFSYGNWYMPKIIKKASASLLREYGIETEEVYNIY